LLSAIIFALVDWVHTIVHLNQPSAQFFQRDAIQRYIAQKQMIISVQNNVH